MKKPIFEPEYFIDEVREGFFVSEMMKRFWASQLTVLYEIVKICDRHSIPWYADMGTLLGAVRHKGYIPWDDDLDISMNREDWELFFECAKDELPEGYQVLSIRTNEEYNLSLGRITNTDCINYNREHMEKFCGCPYCVGVDIFPIDRLYRDPEKEQERKNRGKAIHNVINVINEKGIRSNEAETLLLNIERDNHIKLSRDNKIGRELVLLFERICMECRDDDYEKVALISTWILGDWADCPRNLYEDRVEIPFENTVLQVTDRYGELLKIYYQDYLTVKRSGGAHVYPVYSDQEQILREHIGHNPYRYTYTKDDLAIERKETKFSDRCHEIIELMLKAESHGYNLYRQGDNENGGRILSGCQEMAITLGVLLEDKFGMDCDVVRNLEEYCELLYRITQEQSESVHEALTKRSDEIREKLDGLITGNKIEVVFLPCREVWWDTMKPLYESLLLSDDMNIHLIPIPFRYRDPYGEIGECVDESEFFSSFEGYIGYEDYDIEKKHPDIIVMQVPFDGYSCAMTVSERYYSDNLLRCCDELWYVPCFDPEPPQSSDDKAVSAISVLVEQPAVMHADKIILSSRELRDYYIDRLIDMAGENTRMYWENKTLTMQETEILMQQDDHYE